MRHPRRHIIKITAEEAKQMMDEGNATVVDVRTAEEYAAGHIPRLHSGTGGVHR